MLDFLGCGVDLMPVFALGGASWLGGGGGGREFGRSVPQASQQR